MQPDKKFTFLSCDWGTSSFRLRLVEKNKFHVLAESSSDEGNSSIYELWKNTGQEETERIGFYISILKKHLENIEKKLNTSLDGIPLVVSGMASSNIGMMELPYKEFPFSTHGSDLHTKFIPANNQFNHSILLISGVKTDDDVMRGEETQLIGCKINPSDKDQLFLHPGTHAKHVIVKNSKAIALKTYMTGEFFSLLSTKSILSSSVEKDKGLQDPANTKSFEQGVKDSLKPNLLHQSFMVRTNSLFDKISKQENYFYLSGLLIGTELKDIMQTFSGNIIITGETILVNQYLKAMHCLGIDNKDNHIIIKNSEETTIIGQHEVFSKINR